MHRVSELGDIVAQDQSLLFVPQGEDNGLLRGDYLRDRAYEELRPIVSTFQFAPKSQELVMTTQYTQVVSVDLITLVNPNLRLRRILNYQRPAAGYPLGQVQWVGFGVEQKSIA
jgi:hypothetical protein